MHSQYDIFSRYKTDIAPPSVQLPGYDADYSYARRMHRLTIPGYLSMMLYEGVHSSVVVADNYVRFVDILMGSQYITVGTIPHGHNRSWYHVITVEVGSIIMTKLPYPPRRRHQTMPPPPRHS